MKLKAEYKEIYEATKIGDETRTFCVAKGLPAADDAKLEFTVEGLKFFYEKNGKLYGSTTNIPTEDDVEVAITVNGESIFA